MVIPADPDRVAGADERTQRVRATTILGVRRNGQVALGGDGQVTLGEVVLKHGARKIRTLYDGAVLAGFAGAVADALTLFEKFESQLKAWDGNLRRAAVELTKEWRTDRYLRRLEAQLIVADPESVLLLSGEGDVIEPDDGIVAIGSGGPYATAAAKALLAHTELDARAIVQAAMGVAASICIYTNDQFSVETVQRNEGRDIVTEGDEESDERELPLRDAASARRGAVVRSDVEADEYDEDDDRSRQRAQRQPEKSADRDDEPEGD